MIHIERSQVEKPLIFTDRWRGTRSSKVEKELAIKHHEANPPKENTFNFSVYKNQQIKDTLLKLTHKKCSYCESPIGPTQPVDVEHFRPKSIYYWLAADWDNLLSSCIDCNRARKQKVPGQSERILLGKKDQFPLRKMTAGEDDQITESRRLKSDDTAIHSEPRLLLDPAIDKPEAHLDFLAEGGLVRPRLLNGQDQPDPNGSPSQMGEASIKVYALQREGLVFARYEKLHRLISQIKRVFEAMDVYKADKTADNLAKVKLEMDDVDLLCANEKSYTGMCLQYRDQFKKAIMRKESFDEAIEKIPGAKKVILDAQARVEARADQNSTFQDLFADGLFNEG